MKNQEYKNEYNNFITTQNVVDEGEILLDVSSGGKDRKWKERKQASLRNAERFKELECTEKQYKRYLTCGEYLHFRQDADTGLLKLENAFFCGNKFCAICSWRRSLKYGFQTKETLDEALKQYPSARFLFLTLTIKNVPAKGLSDAIKSGLNKSFDRLFRRAKVKKNLIGFVRAIEVTYNDETNDYHPHIHVLLMVKSTYFKGDGDNYISHEEWTSMWQQSAKLDYVPMVNIKAVKPKVVREDLHDDYSEDGIIKAVLEVAKYPVKPIEIETDKNGKKIERSEELLTQITGELYNGLYKKRQFGFGGTFKEIRQRLHLDDIENGDLVHVSKDDEPASNGQRIIAYWNYFRGNYYIKSNYTTEDDFKK